MFEKSLYKVWQPDHNNEVILTFLRNTHNTESPWLVLKGIYEIGEIDLEVICDKLLLLIESSRPVPFLYMIDTAQTGTYRMFPLSHSPEWNNKIIYALHSDALVEKLEVKHG